ncbi:MAG: demethoxyubiquinone hydroxylase family protein [Rhodospirillaceae bacterium]
MPSAPPRATAQAALPGEPDRETLLARIIRVDHAGEYGARRIYEGQLAILGNRRTGPVIKHMLEQELHHLATFENLMVDRRVRPTMLQPVWHVGAFMLGAATALLGERAAMACTVAVETVIDEHYAEQAAKLGDDEAELRTTVEQFRAEEVEHRNIGLAHEAEKAPAYPLLSALIKTGTRVAIALSERI